MATAVFGSSERGASFRFLVRAKPHGVAGTRRRPPHRRLILAGRGDYVAQASRRYQTAYS